MIGRVKTIEYSARFGGVDQEGQPIVSIQDLESTFVPSVSELLWNNILLAFGHDGDIPPLQYQGQNKREENEIEIKTKIKEEIKQYPNLDEENEAQELYFEYSLSYFSGRQKFLSRLFSSVTAIDGNTPAVQLLCSKHGYGKTTVLAALTRLCMTAAVNSSDMSTSSSVDSELDHKNAVESHTPEDNIRKALNVIYHSTGASSRSCNIHFFLFRLCVQLISILHSHHHHDDDDDNNVSNTTTATTTNIEDLPHDYHSLIPYFHRLLWETSAVLTRIYKYPLILLIIDGIDDFIPFSLAKDTSWLPLVFPKQVRIILSISTKYDEYDFKLKLNEFENNNINSTSIISSLLERNNDSSTGGIINNISTIWLPSLSIDKRRILIRRILVCYRKILTEGIEGESSDQLSSLARKSDSPRFLFLACQELRIFGTHELISKRISEFPTNINFLILQILYRLEYDFGEIIVKRVLSFLRLSREGILEPDILALVGTQKQQSSLYNNYDEKQKYEDNILPSALSIHQKTLHLDAQRTELDFDDIFSSLDDNVSTADSTKQIDLISSKLPSKPLSVVTWRALRQTLLDLHFIHETRILDTSFLDYSLLADNTSAAIISISSPELISAIDEYYLKDPNIRSQMYQQMAQQFNSTAFFNSLLIGNNCCCNDRRLIDAAHYLFASKQLNQLHSLCISLFYLYGCCLAGVLPSLCDICAEACIYWSALLAREHSNNDETYENTMQNTYMKLEQLKSVLSFLRTYGDMLTKHPGLLLQEAYEQPINSPIHIIAERFWIDATTDHPLLSKQWFCSLKTQLQVNNDIDSISDSSNHQNTLLQTFRTSRTVTAMTCTSDFSLLAIACASNVATQNPEVILVFDLCPKKGPLSSEFLKPRLTLLGHHSNIHSLAFSPKPHGSSNYWSDDSNNSSCFHLVSASADSSASIRLWDSKSGRCLAFLERGHDRKVVSVMYSPNGDFLVSGGWDGYICFWPTSVIMMEGNNGGGNRDKYNTAKLYPIVTICYHTRPVTSLAFSPDSRILAVGSWDSSISLWELSTVKKYEEQTRTIQTQKKQRGILLPSIDIASTTIEPLVPWRVLEGHSGSITSLCFNPTGYDINGTFQLASGSSESELFVWVNGVSLVNVRLQLTSISLTHVSYHYNGTRIISGTSTGSLQEWDALGGGHVQTLHTTSWINHVSFSPDTSGSLLCCASQDGSLSFWKHSKSNNNGVLYSHFFDIQAHSAAAKFCCFNENVFACPTQMSHWSQGSEADTNTDSNCYFPFLLSSCSEDETVCVFDLSHVTNDLLLTTLTSTTDEANRRQLLPNAIPVRRLVGHRGTVRCCAFDPSGTFLASGSDDSSLIIWKCAWGSLPSSCDDRETESKELYLRLSHHSRIVEACVFSPNGKYLVSSDRSGEVCFWDSFTSTFVLLSSCRLHDDWVTSLAFSPDSSRLFTASWDFSAKSIRLLETYPQEDSTFATVTLIEEEVLNSHKSAVSGIRICTTSYSASDTYKVVMSSLDGTASIWHVSSHDNQLTKLTQFVAHKNGPANSIACSPDGNFIATTGDDKTLKLWKVEGGTITNSLQSSIGCTTTNDINNSVSTDDSIYLSLIHADDANIMVTAGGGDINGTLHVWNENKTKTTTNESNHKSTTIDKSMSYNSNTTEAHKDVITDVTFLTNKSSSSLAYHAIEGFDGVIGNNTNKEFDLMTPFLATSSRDSLIKLWDFTATNVLRSIDLHSAPVNCLAFSQEFNLLFSGGDDFKIGVSNITDEDQKPFLASSKHHSDSILCLATSITDPTTIISGSSDRTVAIWKCREATISLSTHLELGDWVTSCCLSPLYPVLAAGMWNGDIFLHDLRLRNTRCERLGGAHTGPVRSVSFAPSVSHLLSSSDGDIGLWDYSDISSLKPSNIFSYSDSSIGSISSAKFCQQGSSFFFSVGSDSVLRQWSYKESNRTTQIDSFVSHKKTLTALGMGPTVMDKRATHSLLATGNTAGTISLMSLVQPL